MRNRSVLYLGNTEKDSGGGGGGGGISGMLISYITRGALYFLYK